jgi:WD40 repeat protein
VADIFLSHSSADNDIADWIKVRLERERESWSIFLDKHPRDGIIAGQNWQDRLRSELQSCRIVVAIITPSWLASQWCFTEAVTAAFRGKDFIGVLSDDLSDKDMDAAPPIVHERQRQLLDINTGSGWDELLFALDRSGLDPSQWFPIPPGVGPYPGFVAFEEKDAGVFFGRDQEITQYLDELNLLKAANRAQALVISGGSGSGKSSLLKAGLIPRLRRQPDWLIVPPFDPTREPIHALFSALRTAAKATGANIDLTGDPPSNIEDLITLLENSLRVIEEKANAWLLLPLDQAEVLLASSQKKTENDASRLLAAVWRILASRTRKLVAVLTIRTEFVPTLEHTVPSEARIQNRPLSLITSLSEVIEKPVARFGIELEEGLSGRMVEDTKGTGGLPLLAYTLHQLYKTHGKDKHLTVDEYEQLGGVEGAIEKKLHEAFSDPEPTPEELAAIRRCFVRQLVRVDESAVEGERYLRTAITRDALPTDAGRIVDRLLDAHLLVSGESGTIAIAHERLIRNWADAPLQTWLAEDSKERQLIDTLKSFLKTHREGGPLLSEKPLLDAKDFLERDPALKEDEPELAQFIEKSLLAERSRVQKQKWQFRGAIAASFVFLAVAIGAVWFFLEAQKQTRVAEKQTEIAKAERDRAKEQSKLAETRRLEARKQAELAMARQLSAQSELKRPDVQALEESVLVALESLHLSGTSEATAAVRKTLTLLSRSKLHLTHDQSVQAIAMSADGLYMATGSSDGRASVWFLKSGEERLRVANKQAITSLSLHPQSLYLATGGRDGHAILWDLSSGQEVYRHETGEIEISYTTMNDSKWSRRQEPAGITAVVFSNDGKHLAIAGADGVLKVIDIRSRNPVLTAKVGKSVGQVRFSADDRLVAASGVREVVIWNLVEGEQLGNIPVHAEDLQFGPKGRYIATASRNGKVSLWDVESQNPVAEFRHDQRVSQVQFSPKGDVLWSSSADDTIRQWHIESRREGLRIHSGGWVRFLAVSDDSKYIVSADFGNVARLWKTADGTEVVRFPHESQISAIAFAPDQEHVAVGSVDGVARLWEMRGGSPARELNHGDEVDHFAFSADGASIVTVGNLRSVAKVWQVQGGRHISSHKFDGIGNAAAFTAGGEQLIQTTKDQFLLTRLADRVVVKTSKLEGVELSKGGYSIGGVAISRDGRWVYKEINRIRRLWRIGERGGELHKTFPDSVRTVAFTPDGTCLIIVADADDATKAMIEVHDLEGDRMVSRWVSDEPIHFLAISPDNRFLAMPVTVYSRGWTIWEGPTTFHMAGSTISIVRLNTGEPLKRVTIPNVAVPNQIEMIAFSSDGQFLAAGLANGVSSIVRVADSEEVARISHGTGLIQIAFGPDQSSFVTAGKDGYVRFWNWRPNDLYTAACSRITRNLNIQEWTKYFGEEPYRVTCKNLPPHPSILEHARLLAERGEIDEAREILDQALRLGATIDSAPDQWVNKAAASGQVDDGYRLAKSGRIKAALAAFRNAKRLDPKVKITFVKWNEVCWQGALRRSAEAVIEACNQAVEGAPENGAVHDSRAFVRAQLGDFKGAIADFEVYLSWAPHNKRSEEDILKRKQWIEDLQRGVDPFDAETLKALR